MSSVPTPSESLLQTSGFFCETKRGGTEEGLVQDGFTSTVCPGLVPPQENGGCCDAVFSLERSQSD